MLWYNGHNGLVIAQAKSKQAFASAWNLPLSEVTGPYATKALAEAGGMSNNPVGGSGGGWYVITIRPTDTAPFTVQVSQKPFPKGQVLVDSGPYNTQAEAEAAAQKFKQHSENPFPGASAISTALNPLGSVGDFLSRLGEPQTWIRVGEVVVGVMLLGIGVYVVVKDTSAGKAGKKGLSLVTDVIPQTRALKTATKARRKMPRSKAS